MPRKTVSVVAAPTKVQRIPVTLPPLHAKQQEVFDCKARYRVLRCGRRWGKSYLGVVEAFHAAIQGNPVWWIAPSYTVANVGWWEIRSLGNQLPGAQIREADRMVLLPGNKDAWIQVRSAENPDSLRGYSLGLAIFDEFAFMEERAWTEAIRPALSDRQGRALFISTPFGKNHYWQLWQRAVDDESGDWQAFHYTSYDNPHVPAKEIDDARRDMPEAKFKQEFLAEFLEDGAVFRGVDEAAVASVQYKAADGHTYVIGCDWGKHDDYTVFAVIDRTTRELCFLDRSNRVNFSLQVERLKALSERFGRPLIVSEGNSQGNVINEQVWKEGLNMREFITGNQSKAEAVEALIVAFEQGKLRIIPDSHLLGELRAFASERLPSGRMRYGAPKGFHDDTVMALALAWDAAKHDPTPPPKKREPVAVTNDVVYQRPRRRRFMSWK